jgi:glutamate dehydrogenase (NAD(P)+)
MLSAMESPLIILASGPDYEGFLVIDSLFEERSSGGVRIAPDLALDEIRQLAKEMTLKFALFRLPRGGAKAGIRLASDLDPQARRLALQGFGRQIGPLLRAGLYYPGTDMNCGFEELRLIYGGAGLPVARSADTAFFTAIGVADAIQGAALALDLRSPVTLAIEGFGSVATHLAELLPADRFSIRAISTIAGALERPDGFAPRELKGARDEHGNELVRRLPGIERSLDDVLTSDADILIPAARTGTITEDVANRIRARAVIPAANAPYRPGAADRLHERGVLCLPGCLCNAGGVFGSSMADSGVPRARIQRLFESRFRPMVRDLVAACARRRLSPIAVVEAMAAREATARALASAPGGSPARLPERLVRKLRREAARRLPRSLRRRTMWRLATRAFDAMEADFREV